MKIAEKLKLLVVGLALALAMTPAMVMAEDVKQKVVCPAGSENQFQEVGSYSECKAKGANDLTNTMTNIVNVVIGAIGFVAVVMIVVGGVGYTTSAGDAAKVKKAKDTIMYGVIGLVVAMLAFAIVNFILGGIFKSQG